MLYNPPIHYSNGTQYTNPIGYTGTATTDASGNLTFYLTDNGLSTGNTVFPNTVFFESIQMTGWSTSRIILFDVPVVSSDRKTITIAVKYNSSLLSLGLIPFTTAAAGIIVHLECKGN